MAKLIQVIESSTKRGLGQDSHDPVRQVQQFFSTDGEMLAENDCGMPDAQAYKIAKMINEKIEGNEEMGKAFRSMSIDEAGSFINEIKAEIKVILCVWYEGMGEQG